MPSVTHPSDRDPLLPQGFLKPNTTPPDYPHASSFRHWLPKHPKRNQGCPGRISALHPFPSQSKALGRGSVCRAVLKESKPRGGTWLPGFHKLGSDTRREAPPAEGVVPSRLRLTASGLYYPREAGNLGCPTCDKR